MLLEVIFLCVACFSQSTAIPFTNPLATISIPYPRALLYDGLYYVIAESTSGNNSCPIYISEDLQNWEFATYAFNNENRPEWSTILPRYPSLQVLPNKQIRLFYYTDRAATGFDAAAAAVATDILGPYSAISGPIGGTSINFNQLYSIVGVDNVDETVYLYSSFTTPITGQALSKNGLNLLSDSAPVVPLLSAAVAWELPFVRFPFFLQHSAYYYLFYSGGTSSACNRTAIGVARSSSPLGPFEKYANNPILSNYGSFISPHSPSVVKDVDGHTDVLIYGAFDTTVGCATTYLSSKKLSWDINGWPHPVD